MVCRRRTPPSPVFFVTPSPPTKNHRCAAAAAGKNWPKRRRRLHLRRRRGLLVTTAVRRARKRKRKETKKAAKTYSVISVSNYCNSLVVHFFIGSVCSLGENSKKGSNNVIVCKKKLSICFKAKGRPTQYDRALGPRM